jgi:hypothetical protein
VKIFDSSYLIALLHSNPQPPKDRQDKVVTRFKERIEHLTAELNASSDIIGIPTPAMAEVLVRAGKNRPQYMTVLGDSWKFQILPFDSRAAIETAELIEAVKTKKEKWDTWAKVKFDIQIVAIAKAEAATVIYSDDQDIENYAKRFNIRVIRICDLPLPPSDSVTPIDAGPVGSQIPLALADALTSVAKPEVQPAPEAKPDETTHTKQLISTGADGTTKAVQPSNELKADPTHPPAIQGVPRIEQKSQSPPIKAD